jgi:hypothetical protein
MARKPNPEMSENDRKVLKALRFFWETQAQAPTYRQVATHAKISSTATVRHAYKRLIGLGKVVQTGRGYCPVDILKNLQGQARGGEEIVHREDVITW